ncbi:MAG: RcpC/CpaB family pilus assembly protein, partial [Alphaproteobacteria bacterium]
APGGQSRVRSTDLVVRNVRVLAVNQATKADDNANSIAAPATVTLEVTPEAHLALVEAMSQGDLHLALRSYADVGPKSQVVRPRTQVAREQEGQTVRIFSGGKMIEVQVAQ